MEAADKEMVADTLAQTKGLGDTIGTLPDARQTTEGIKQGMTLIDRFYNGGNMARQGVADILVTVLDQVIGRMRQRNANAQATISRCNEECATLDKAIAVLTRTSRALRTVRARGAGQLGPGRHALYARRTSLGRAIHTAYRGTTGHRQDRGQVRAVTGGARDEEGEGGGAA